MYNYICFIMFMLPFFSPSIHSARWAYKHRFLSVWLDKNSRTIRMYFQRKCKRSCRWVSRVKVMILVGGLTYMKKLLPLYLRMLMSLLGNWDCPLKRERERERERETLVHYELFVNWVSESVPFHPFYFTPSWCVGHTNGQTEICYQLEYLSHM